MSSRGRCSLVFFVVSLITPFEPIPKPAKGPPDEENNEVGNETKQETYLESAHLCGGNRLRDCSDNLVLACS